MDPDATLTEMRELAGHVLDVEGGNADDAVELAERVRALDHWIGQGGFLPHEWAQAAVRLDQPRTKER